MSNKNQTNLEVGQVFKNYKAICEWLGVEPTKGKGRQYHIKEFERYCTYHKEGQKFIVDIVYDECQEKVDNRGKHISHTIYEDLMDKLIMDLLATRCCMEVSFNEIFVENFIPIITDNYSDLLECGYEIYANTNGMSKGLVREYMLKLRQIVQKCFETSLNRLSKKCLLYWDKTTWKNTSHGKGEMLPDELKLLEEVEKLAYSELEISSQSRINPKINRQFKEFVINQLKEDIPHITSYWKVYIIAENDEEDKCKYGECVKFATEEEREKVLKELTNRFIVQVHKAVLNRSYDKGKTKPYNNSRHVGSLMELDKVLFVHYDKNFKDEVNGAFVNVELAKLFAQAKQLEQDDVWGEQSEMFDYTTMNKDTTYITQHEMLEYDRQCGIPF